MYTTLRKMVWLQLLLMLLPVAAQERKYICKDPDDYTPSLLVGSSRE